MLRNTFLVLALAAVFGAAGVSASAGATKAATGFKFVIQYGPICTKTSKYCKYIPEVGWKVVLSRGGKVVAQGTTNSQGAVTLSAAPGAGYSYRFSGKLNGKAYAKSGKAPPAIAGLVMPFYLHLAP